MPGEFLPDLTGEYYRGVLGRLHAVLRPKTYLEIGVEIGATLALAECPFIAIDPVFRFPNTETVEKILRCKTALLFQMTSDQFFANNHPDLLLGAPIDMAFLDGDHKCEALLRDFVNVEKFCKKNSVVILHDCLPVEEGIAARTQIASSHSAPEHAGWWTGDVWRTALLLKRKRPDLKILSIDAAPTGLVLITNLDPDSTALASAYFDDVEEMLSWSLADGGLQALHAELAVKPASVLASGEAISAYFWL